jgi:uncharacterized damage-inducible protein DinB
MKARYRMFTGYNAWCNERLYDAAAKVADADYRAHRGVYFKSLHGTLNHLLVGDRFWMKRFTGVVKSRRASTRCCMTIFRTCAPRGAARTC